MIINDSIINAKEILQIKQKIMNKKTNKPLILVFNMGFPVETDMSIVMKTCKQIYNDLINQHKNNNVICYVNPVYGCNTTIECINPVFLDKRKNYSEYYKIKQILEKIKKRYIEEENCNE